MTDQSIASPSSAGTSGLWHVQHHVYLFCVHMHLAVFAHRAPRARYQTCSIICRNRTWTASLKTWCWKLALYGTSSRVDRCSISFQYCKTHRSALVGGSNCIGALVDQCTCPVTTHCGEIVDLRTGTCIVRRDIVPFTPIARRITLAHNPHSHTTG